MCEPQQYSESFTEEDEELENQIMADEDTWPF